MKKKDPYYYRILLLFGLFGILCMIITIQLINIQILNCNKYSKLATSQREIKLLTTELRGSFYDRNRTIIRGTKKASFLLINNSYKILDSLTKIQPYFPETLIKEYQSNSNTAQWMYSKPLTPRQLNVINTIQNPHFTVIQAPVGRDPHDLLAWHLLGEANPNNYSSGLERTFDSLLQNSRDSGAVISIVDASKRHITGLRLRIQENLNKNGVVLTIDSRIQKIVETIIDQEQEFEGAVVILDVANGEILAMASRPIINSTNIAASLKSSNSPFINRAVTAYYPGSIVKLILLSAGLDSGIIQPDSEVYDTGFFEVNNKKILCTTSNGMGHGQFSLTDAFAYSCNPVFLEIARRLTPKTFIEYINRFKLGQKCNIGLNEESSGKVPTKQTLSLGEQANLALGQEHITATPLQIASIIQTIANDGVRINPTLVKGYLNSQGNYIPTQEIIKEKVINYHTAKTIQKMMAAVTGYGTGTEAQTIMGSAGKTGTAQTSTSQTTPPYAWFAGYVPQNNPKYAGVIFCEKGISGGKSAAPIFRKIMEEINTL
ncbi:MAG TPA: penicillin-binding transpeptidase domain-containing protein [Bacillota bacterium]|nr:penicillin-binding transpeptidase domain-containing protein [Bacillota bacterium]HOL10301.1 penicillin-binding transpeptidase domain-containing protein [Bacillota bacterium]HPO97419.1 penicillin-binding transpeptidase domain-containing protein [Bacillota bacterium]